MARADGTLAQIRQTSDVYYPLLAVQIIFETSSPTITSVAGVSNLPGTAIEGALQSVSTTSQEIFPEEGRATIGGCTVKIVDGTSPQSLTEEFREQLIANDGVRDAEVRIWHGGDDDFDNWNQVGTYYVDDVSLQNGVYTIRCRDKNKFLREQIFEPKTILAGAAIGAEDTTITAASDVATAGFQTIDTHAGWTGGPSGTYGWIRIKSTGEIIRYTGISGSTFTGCTRGQFRTKAQAVEYDSDSPEEIEEFIYLEGPAVWCARAILTGQVDPTVSPIPTLPTHWHLGLDPDDLTSAWANIGADLYDPNDLSKGFPVRFTHLDSVDGKAFLEKEIYRLIGVFSPITALGKLGLKRIQTVSTTASQFTINDDRIFRISALKHDTRAVRNNFSVEYNWDGEDLTRRLVVVDSVSQSRHGKAKQTKLAFKGLHTAKHTKAAIISILTTLRDRYAEPPLRLTIDVPWRYNACEVGDTVRVSASVLKDFADVDATEAETLSRVFEIQGIRVNWTGGQVTLNLFASSREAGAVVFNDATTAVLDDTWYDGTAHSPNIGTDISGLGGYSGGTLTSYTFAGGTDINDTGSIFYHLGDLTLASCSLTGNVQLRVRGTLTITGTLDGVGGGLSGVSDPDTVNSTSTGWARTGNDGWIGPNRAGSGIWIFGNVRFAEVPGAANGSQSAAPRPALNVDSAGFLTNEFPSDLRGSGGAPGGQVVEGNYATIATPGTGGLVMAKGGAGGDGGAGLLIVSRGLAFGVNARIDLSGVQGSAGQETANVAPSGKQVWDVPKSVDNRSLEAGGGASGTPGAMVVILDGDITPYPDLTSSTFRANLYAVQSTGITPYEVEDARPELLSIPLQVPRLVWRADQFRGLSPINSTVRGYSNDTVITGGNLWRAAHSVQYVPNTKSLTEDVTPAPTSLTATAVVGSVRLDFSAPSAKVREVEVWTSLVNDRAFAEKAAVTQAASAIVAQAYGRVGYFWIRNVGFDDRVSDWYPSGATSGVEGQSLSLTQFIADPGFSYKDSWVYQEGSPLADIDGLTYSTVSLYGKSVPCWNFREGSGTVTVWAVKREGPSEFDATIQPQSVLSPQDPTELKLQVNCAWILDEAGSWADSTTSLYLAIEFYNENGDSSQQVTNATFQLDTIINKNLNQWYSVNKVLTIPYSLLTGSPNPPTPHSMRFGLTVSPNATSSGSPLGQFRVVGLNITAAGS